jgi:NADH-quinone oxidoreductase subunit A
MFLLSDYIIILYFVFVGLILVLVLFSLAYFFTPKYFVNNEKISVYECGFQPFHTTRVPYDVHFYIIGILFLIFDIEIVFIYPWLTIAYYTGFSGFFYLGVFIVILLIGFVYEWKKHILDWSKKLLD